MPNFELLDTVKQRPENIHLPKNNLPKIVHLDDPATAVMRDFQRNGPDRINERFGLDDALNEMKTASCHLLFVIDDNDQLLGLLSTEDILGEKPIQLMTQSRIERQRITVKMIMTPINEIEIFNYQSIQSARVGNIVTTMQALKIHYALIIEENTEASDRPIIRGLLNTSQISKQLHSNIERKITKADSVSELKKRL